VGLLSRTSWNLAVLLAINCVGACGQNVVIENVRIVDGTGAGARTGSVAVKDGRIVAVGENVPTPTGALKIDGQGKTLLPGLFDLHTHLRASAASGLAADWGKDLEAYLAAGVTSVDDFGNYGEMFAPMRKLLDTGFVRGPRLHLAVRISPPGGHGTESGYGDMFTLEASTPEAAHAAMRQALLSKPDVIKIFTDGWRYGTIPNLMSMNEETIAAIVQDAHAAGIKVLTHTVSLDNAKITVRAGVDSLVHGIQDREVDPEFVSLIKSKGTAYVSTLAVYEPRDRNMLYPGLENVLEPAIEAILKGPPSPRGEGGNSEGRTARWKSLLANEKTLYDAGVTLGNGTDAGMPGTFHGWATLREMELKTQAGLTPLQVITIATRNSARMLGVDKDLGTIEPGKLADLVLVSGKPDENIPEIYKTSRVFLNGRDYDPAELSRDVRSETMSKLPSSPIGSLVDDFERGDGRTELGTLRVNGTDPGIDHSKILFTRTARSSTNHALTILAQMGPKQHNFALLHLPLTPGAVELADVTKFRGISFDARGDSTCRLRVSTYSVRQGQDWNAPFPTSAEWKTQKIEFSSLTRKDGPTVAWTGTDLRDLVFELSGPPGSSQWLEIDNLRFF
jgi:imidazolonepropionase-like amidohydrolase